MCVCARVIIVFVIVVIAVVFFICNIRFIWFLLYIFAFVVIMTVVVVIVLSDVRCAFLIATQYLSYSNWWLPQRLTGRLTDRN